MIGGHAKSIAESYNPQCVQYIAVLLSEQFNSWVDDVGATICKYTYVRNRYVDLQHGVRIMHLAEAKKQNTYTCMCTYVRTLSMCGLRKYKYVQTYVHT